MKILMISAYTPFGTDDAYYIEEFLEMKRQGQALVIVPCSPRKKCTNKDAEPLLSDTIREPLLSFAVFRAAFIEGVSHPIRALGMIPVLAQSNSLGHLLKNVGMCVRGLWMARLANRLEVGHIHACNATSCATAALFASYWTGIPWSFTAHKHDIIIDNLFRLKYERAEWARFISQWGLDYAIANVMRGAGMEKAFVLHMGVSVPPPPGPIPDDVRVALCPARVIPLKGQRYLLEAMGMLRRKGVHFDLRIAGDGSDMEPLKNEVHALGLDERVSFLGQVAHGDLLAMYRNRSVSVVVLPSTIEGIPVSLMEAMSYGVPVIATAVGGTPELLHGGAGVLVPARDSSALADALESLFTDPSSRPRLAEAGRARVLQAFHSKEVIRELLGRFRAPAPPAGAAAEG